MALPRIESYPLPQAHELPAARVPWRVEPARAALLVHDLQRYFVRAFGAESALMDGVVANILRLRAACDAAGVPVIYTAQPGHQDRRDRGLQADFWGPGMSDDPADRDIDARLAPRAGDLVLTKWRYSAFQRTTLEPMLRARGRDQLIVTGVYAHIGCLLSAADAFMRDIEPFLAADALGDFSRERHDAALAYGADRCAVAATTATLVEALSQS